MLLLFLISISLCFNHTLIISLRVHLVFLKTITISYLLLIFSLVFNSDVFSGTFLQLPEHDFAAALILYVRLRR